MSAGTTPRGPAATLALIARFTTRELRGGLRGFRIFVAALALGVAAIAAVGSVSHAMRDTIAGQGREILGADINFALIQRRASDVERSWIDTLGTTSEVATLRALARRDEANPTPDGALKPVPDGAVGQVLVEIKAIDGRYPLFGATTIEGGTDWRARLGRQTDGTFGALMERSLGDRLGVKIGDRIAIGRTNLTLTGLLTGEPDKLSAGIGFGPRLMIATPALDATGLVQPGSLIRWTYRVALPPDNATTARLDAVKTEAAKRFPAAGWEIRTRNDASPGLVSNIENFASFLTLVGLTALIVGGVGVANAIRAFVATKRDVIGILKCLGASGNLIFALYGGEVLIVAAIGIAIGLLGGVALTALAAYFLSGVLPIATSDPVYPSELALAALYGLLTAATFALPPLGRTHDMQPAALFRDGIAPETIRPRWRYLIATVASGLALVCVAVALAPDRWLAAGYLLATVGVFVVLRLLAAGVALLARKMPRLPTTELRMAIANLHRPGNATASVLLSLGLGLTLMVSLSLIDTNLRAQLGSQLPKTVPSFFFLDIATDELAPFAADIAKNAPQARFESVPILRGRIVAVKGIAAEKLDVPPRSAFLLRSDRGMTFSATLPKNSTLVDGTWWPEGYDGDPLVSIDRQLADDLGIHLGDHLTINVLGRDIEAKVSNTRKLEWSTFGINFFMVFSPNTFEGAPIGHLATVAFPPDTADSVEYRLLADVSRDFPTITAIRVKDQLKTVDDLIGQIATGVAAAASVAILTAILVLAGAFAASQEQRIYVAVILKTLGATRARIIAALTLEFVLLGLIAAAIALGAGTLAAWLIISRVMHLAFTLSPVVAGVTIIGALVVTLALGLANTLVALNRNATAALRQR
jgi:putative ABC transport system permease protein